MTADPTTTTWASNYLQSGWRPSVSWVGEDEDGDKWEKGESMRRKSHHCPDLLRYVHDCHIYSYCCWKEWLGRVKIKRSVHFWFVHKKIDTETVANITIRGGGKLEAPLGIQCWKYFWKRLSINQSTNKHYLNLLYQHHGLKIVLSKCTHSSTMNSTICTVTSWSPPPHKACDPIKTGDWLTTEEFNC